VKVVGWWVVHFVASFADDVSKSEILLSMALAPKDFRENPEERSGPMDLIVLMFPTKIYINVSLLPASFLLLYCKLLIARDSYYNCT